MTAIEELSEIMNQTGKLIISSGQKEYKIGDIISDLQEATKGKVELPFFIKRKATLKEWKEQMKVMKQLRGTEISIFEGQNYYEVTTD